MSRTCSSRAAPHGRAKSQCVARRREPRRDHSRPARRKPGARSRRQHLRFGLRGLGHRPDGRCDPDRAAVLGRFDLDWRIFIFALAAGVLSSVVFGLLPALQASNPQLVDALKEGGRTGAAGGKSQRVRNVLVVAEVALALTLLIGAGLMLRSFMAIQKSDLGIDPRNTLTFRVGLHGCSIRTKTRLAVSLSS
jgi:hypothetical protein